MDLDEKNPGFDDHYDILNQEIAHILKKNKQLTGKNIDEAWIKTNIFDSYDYRDIGKFITIDDCDIAEEILEGDEDIDKIRYGFNKSDVFMYIASALIYHNGNYFEDFDDEKIPENDIERIKTKKKNNHESSDGLYKAASSVIYYLDDELFKCASTAQKEYPIEYGTIKIAKFNTAEDYWTLQFIKMADDTMRILIYTQNSLKDRRISVKLKDGDTVYLLANLCGIEENSVREFDVDLKQIPLVEWKVNRKDYDHKIYIEEE